MCPCEGFAYGERGDLDIVRVREGMPDQRLNLSPFFIAGEAMLPKWAPIPGDEENEPTEDTLETRPTVEIMRLADYDRDGRATEFPLQIGARACGHTQTLLVGISKARPELHAFGTRQAPDVPIVLEHFDDWAKLLLSPKATLGQWACGDHGAPDDISLELRASSGKLSARTIIRRCPEE